MTQPIFLDKPSVCAAVSLSEGVWEQLVQSGQAPKPRQLSGRRVGWLLREVMEWAETRPVSELPPPPNTGNRRKRVDNAAEAAHENAH